ncbi:hypothetical protein NKI88_11095 [Mesorhizobium sp. M0317]
MMVSGIDTQERHFMKHAVRTMLSLMLALAPIPAGAQDSGQGATRL